MLFVELMRAFNRFHVELDTQSRRFRQIDIAANDLQRIAGELLPVLPDPVRVERSDAARRSGAHMREHRQ
ncbi:Uncharacterised protein [Mycobacteroides abscessus subsp. abscessus]|nr:Uncharacterised protein [Mycobacteroides abscessus subsp. abscessus]